MCLASLKQMVVSLFRSHLGKVTYSVFPRSQQFTVFDEELCSQMNTRPEMQVRVPYSIYSSLLYHWMCILTCSDTAVNASFVADYRENNYNRNMEMSRRLFSVPW